MNIVVDNATKKVLMAGNDLTAAQINSQYTTWCNNYRPTAAFTVYEGVTLPTGFLPMCWSYDPGASPQWAVLTDSQYLIDEELSIINVGLPPSNVVFTSFIHTDASGQALLGLHGTWLPSGMQVFAQIQYARIYTDLWSEIFETVESSISITGLGIGDYKVRIRGLAADRQASTWAECAVAVVGDTTVPNVSGLQIYGQGNDATFLGRDVHFVWNKVSAGVDTNATLPASQQQSGDWFRYYILTLFTGAGATLRTEYLTEESYIYTYEKNVADGGPSRTVVAELRAMSVQGTVSAIPARLAAYNPQPGAIG